jgi:nitrite reductase (NO-forming)
MILPKEGLRDNKGNLVTYDRAYYVGEQGWYVPQDAQGNYKRYPNAVASMCAAPPSIIASIRLWFT